MVGLATVLRILAMIAALPKPSQAPCIFICEDSGAVDDAGFRRVCQWDFYDVNPEQRRPVITGNARDATR